MYVEVGWVEWISAHILKTAWVYCYFVNWFQTSVFFWDLLFDFCFLRCGDFTIVALLVDGLPYTIVFVAHQGFAHCVVQGQEQCAANLVRLCDEMLKLCVPHAFQHLFYVSGLSFWCLLLLNGLSAWTSGPSFLCNCSMISSLNKLLPMLVSRGRLVSSVSDISLKATSGLQNHSQYPECTRLKTMFSSGKPSTWPLLRTKFFANWLRYGIPFLRGYSVLDVAFFLARFKKKGDKGWYLICLVFLLPWG